MGSVASGTVPSSVAHTTLVNKMTYTDPENIFFTLESQDTVEGKQHPARPLSYLFSLLFFQLLDFHETCLILPVLIRVLAPVLRRTLVPCVCVCVCLSVLVIPALDFHCDYLFSFLGI